MTQFLNKGLVLITTFFLTTISLLPSHGKIKKIDGAIVDNLWKSKQFRAVIPYAISGPKKTKSSKNSKALAMGRTNQTDIFIKNDQLSSALQYNKMFSKFRIDPITVNQNNTVIETRAKIQMAQSTYQKALKALKAKSLKNGKLPGSRCHVELKAKVLNLLGRWESEKKVLRMRDTFRDSIDKQHKKMMKAGIEFQKEMLQTNLKPKETEKATNSLSTEKKQRTLWTLLLLLGLIFITLTSWFIIKKQHQKLRKKEIEVALKQKALQKLNRELEAKKQELAEKALVSLEEKERLLNFIDQLGDKEASKKARAISGSKNDWPEFREKFNELHPNFFTKILATFPSITSSELNVVALVSLRLSSKEIARLLGITVQGVEKSRYRIRKKMKLSSGESLYKALITFTSMST